MNSEFPSTVAFVPRRVVVLGASNVARGLNQFIRVAHESWEAPLEFFLAHGHGRSYGITSRLFGRELPGILACGLWQALAERPAAATSALLTDVGNDIAYGIAPDQILAWVEECAARLKPHATQITLTELPLAKLLTVGEREFRWLARLLFPASRLTRKIVLARAEIVNEGLLSLARRENFVVVRPSLEWYAWDPIHIRRRDHAAAWRAMLGLPCDIAPRDARAPISLPWKERIAGFSPAEKNFFGIFRGRPQPSGRLRCGSTLWSY